MQRPAGSFSSSGKFGPPAHHRQLVLKPEAAEESIDSKKVMAQTLRKSTKWSLDQPYDWLFH